MLVSAIVAVSRNNVIGKSNDIPWYLPADLVYFKRTTLGHCIIMGRNTFASIGRPLPKRTNIVLTRDPFFVGENIEVARSIEEALGIAFDLEETEAFIIGGGDIYKGSMELLDKIYLTEVDIEVADGEVFFPELDASEWKEISRVAHPADEKNEWAYTFRVLERVPTEEDSDQTE